MKTLFESFAKFLGFFLALIVFFLLLSLILIFSDNARKSNFSYLQGNTDSENIIAVIKISGPIISEPINFQNFDVFKSFEIIYPQMIKKYLDELNQKNIKGLIISINSPGGSVSASQKVFKLISNFKKQKNIPIYFHTNDLLTSGGYWVSLSGNKIYASYGALVGSIGVKGPDWLYYNNPTSISSGIFGGSVESPNGIKMFSNVAGKSKDIFNPFRKPTQKEILELQKMVNEIYDDFITIISSNRKIEKEVLKNEIGAMVFNSKAAKKHFLIDDQKNIEEIINIISKKLSLKDKKIIINANKMKYNFINFNNLFDQNNINYNLIINKKICDNMINGFSSISAINYSIRC